MPMATIVSSEFHGNTSLLLLAFVLVLGTVIGATFLSGYADRTPALSERTVTV